MMVLAIIGRHELLCKACLGMGPARRQLDRANSYWTVSVSRVSDRIMKKKLLITISVLAFALMTPGNAAAVGEDNGGAIMADALIARPICLAATALGTAVFVVSLPFALITHGVDRSAKALVVTPAKATFTRPLGDFESLKD